MPVAVARTTKRAVAMQWGHPVLEGQRGELPGDAELSAAHQHCVD
jgi:hypothetical protein